jgi:hypothetical protein
MAWWVLLLLLFDLAAADTLNLRCRQRRCCHLSPEQPRHPDCLPCPTHAQLLLQLVGAGVSQPACATVHAPLALLPVPYPRDTFLQAKQAALAFNSMVDAVSRDEPYLQTVLAAAAQEDEFTVRGCSCHELAAHAFTAGACCSVLAGRPLQDLQISCALASSLLLLLLDPSALCLPPPSPLLAG